MVGFEMGSLPSSTKKVLASSANGLDASSVGASPESSKNGLNSPSSAIAFGSLAFP